VLKWVSDKSLSRYFKDIMRYPLLSREAEEAYARRARLGDVIVRMNGSRVQSRGSFLRRLRSVGSKGLAKLTILRGEEYQDVTLKLPKTLPPLKEQKKEDAFLCGMKLIEISKLTPEEQKTLKAAYGLLIKEVEPGSAAAAADLRSYNLDARNVLILHNLRWVVSISKQYQNRGLQLAELINEGNLGLIQAVSKFDETRKTRLTTYSNWWIRYYVVSALASRHLIKLPIKMRNLAKKIRDNYGPLTQDLGRTPSIEELARELKVSPDEVSAAFNCGVAELSIDALPFEDSKITFEEVLKDTTSPTPEGLSARGQIEHDIRKSIVEALTDRELYVICRHFGVPLPDKHFSKESLMGIFGTSKTKTENILCSASRKLLSLLRQGIGNKGLINYVKFTEGEVKDLTNLLNSSTTKSRRKMALLMRKTLKNLPSAFADYLDELEIIEAEMFILFWGIRPVRDELNLRELGDLLGVSREAARQVKERAIKKLKKNISPHAFEDFFRDAV